MVAAAACAAAPMSRAEMTRPVQSRVGDALVDESTITLAPGGSQIVSLPDGIQTVSVPLPGIVGVDLVSPKTAVIVGRKAGAVDVIFTGRARICRYHVVVSDAQTPPRR